LSFDEACGLVVALAGFLPPGGALAGALVLDVDDRQPEQLDDGVVGREVAAGLGDLPQLVVQRLPGNLEPGGRAGLEPGLFLRGQCPRRSRVRRLGRC
jgi:hypothetical protein